MSLRQLDPVALLTLKSAGTCQVTVPEWLYDLDCPGHYLRRIKTVSLSVVPRPAAGTGVYCTVSLLRSSIRKSPLLKDGAYARQGVGDDRFTDYAGAVQSMVTSTGDRDGGLFETDLGDDRYLPFEGAGAVSSWKLDLPTEYPAFDYAAIDDVILHVRYTARQGVDGTKVNAALDELFAEATDGGPDFRLLFHVQQDFAAEWSSFTGGAGPLQVPVRRADFPYFTHGRPLTITGLDLYAQNVAKHHAAGDPAGATADLQGGGTFTFSAAPDPPGPTQVLTRATTTPVFLAVRYTL